MSKITNKFLADLLQVAKKELIASESNDPTKLDQIWSLTVGEKIALLTKVVSLNHGILVVNVMGSTLNNLLSRTEKPKILTKLKKEYPFLKIKNLIFRSG